jgi:hypothetical protein
MITDGTRREKGGGHVRLRRTAEALRASCRGVSEADSRFLYYKDNKNMVIIFL